MTEIYSVSEETTTLEPTTILSTTDLIDPLNSDETFTTILPSTSVNASRFTLDLASIPEDMIPQIIGCEDVICVRTLKFEPNNCLVKNYSGIDFCQNTGEEFLIPGPIDCPVYDCTKRPNVVPSSTLAVASKLILKVCFLLESY